MLDTLINIDRNLFVALNGMHTALMDPVMWWISDRFIWIPFYILLSGFLYKKFGTQSIFMVLFSVLLILLSDQISVMFKNFFLRERPCHDELLAFTTHIVNNKCGGTYGFVSSHAANTMGVFTYLILLARNHNKSITIVTGIWVILIGYSRIYLGVHFPADIVGGWIVGIFSAGVTYFVYRAIFDSPGIALSKK